MGVHVCVRACMCMCACVCEGRGRVMLVRHLCVLRVSFWCPEHCLFLFDWLNPGYVGVRKAIENVTLRFTADAD